MKVFLLFFIIPFITFAQSKDTLEITIQLNSKVSDYSEVFQKALNTKTNKALKINVKKGNYYLKTNISTTSDYTVVNFEKGTNIYFPDHENTGILVKNDNCVIKNGNFIGDGITTQSFYTGYGILLSGVKNCVIKNNTFSKISGINVFLFPRNGTIGCSDNIIENNMFDFPAMDTGYNADDAFIMLGYSGHGYEHNRNIIKNNTFNGRDFLDVGIGIIGHGNDNKIEGNNVANLLSYGIISYESEDDETTLNGTKVINNTVKNIGQIGNKKTVKGMGIYFMKSNSSLVSGNKVYNALRNSDETETLGAGAISVGMSPNTIIQNNVIDNSNMYGIVTTYSFNSQIINNTISNIRKSGAYFINESDIKVTKNTFRNINEVVLKGYFQNTSLDNIKQMYNRSKTYVNKNTGSGIHIFDNKFYTDKEVLYFTGTPYNATKNDKGNLIKNNIFENNTIIGNSKNNQTSIAFRNEINNSNTIRGNIFTK